MTREKKYLKRYVGLYSPPNHSLVSTSPYRKLLKLSTNPPSFRLTPHMCDLLCTTIEIQVEYDPFTNVFLGTNDAVGILEIGNTVEELRWNCITGIYLAVKFYVIDHRTAVDPDCVEIRWNFEKICDVTKMENLMNQRKNLPIPLDLKKIPTKRCNSKPSE